MQYLTLLSLALSVSGAAAQRGSYNAGKAGITRQKIDNGVIGGRYMVEFQEGLRKRSPDGDHISHFYRTLRARGIETTPQLNITSEVFDGVSFQVESAAQIEDLKALEAVKNVWAVRRIPKPRPIIHAVGLDAQPQWTSHLNTGVLDLHKQGIMGEGATVAIIDTGIDYNHPSLGGGIGPGFKIIGGTDIVGDNYAGKEFFPDENPDDVTGHGTHVAGIVAASGDENFVSVAPKAKLLAYKVFGNAYEYTGTDALIAAFVKAYEDGADVINASIGGPSGWPEDAWGSVASRLVEKGIFIAISQGNSGDVGIWYASSGATGSEVTAVASLDTETYLAFNSKIENSEVAAAPYLAPQLKPFAINSTLPIYAISKDSSVTDDACKPLPEGTPDLSNYLVLVKRGSCPFSQKESMVAAAGAKWIWFYNEADRPAVYPSVPDPLAQGWAMITNEHGVKIVKDIAAGKEVKVSFPAGPPTSLPNGISGGKASTYTSWGPDNEGHMKPEIAAPGGNIFSTYPLEMGGHAILSGTSMASPYIAGVAALYMGKNGGRAKMGPAGIKSLKNKILTSGTLVPFSDGAKSDPSRLAPVAQQGAGYINAKKLFYDTTVFPGKLELNDTQHFKGGHYINIKNTGSKEVFYTLSHEAAATVNSYKANFVDPQIFPPTLIDPVASVEFSVERVSVRPGTTNSFKVTITPPDVDAALLPVYSGKIVITGTNGETLSVPYMGVVGNMMDMKIWDLENAEPVFLDDETGSNLEENVPKNFTLQGFSRPAAVMINHFGAVENRWDIVAADWNKRDWVYPPVEGKDRYVGSVVDVYDGVLFPTRYTPRNNPLTSSYYFYYAWMGQLTNGTTITSGSYRMLLSTLKPFGNPQRNQDWQMKLSPVISIVPAKPAEP